MTDRRTLDVSHLPPYSISNQDPLWWGQVLLAAIEGSMFAILIAMYFYMRLSVDEWPTPGIYAPHRLLPTLGLIPLLASCIGTYMASEAAKRDDRRGMLRGMLLNIGLALIYTAMRVVEWRSWNFNWAADAY